MIVLLTTLPARADDLEMGDPVARWATGKSCRLCMNPAVTYVLFSGQQMWLCEQHLEDYFDVATEVVGPPAPRMTLDQARSAGVPGWNIRCNRCGTYGAKWIPGERPDVGALALCPRDEEALVAEYDRHRRALEELRAVRFEQCMKALAE